jgi:hypothetical protein
VRLLATIVVAMLLAMVALPGVAMAATPVAGTIEGKLINGTAGGSGVGGLEVGLFSLNSDNTTGHWSATTDSSGRFVFGDLSADAGSAYAVGATFQGADYFTEVVKFSDNETRKSIDLTVYDATEDDSAIRIVNAHTIVFLEGDALRIQEVYVFANMSDRTYVGSLAADGNHRQTLRFSLPAGFGELNLGGDLAAAGITASSSGFVDTLPVPPGSKQAFYSYRLGLKSGSYTYSRGVDYPTVKYSMLVQGDKVSLSGDRLTSSGTTDMGGTLFSGVAGTDLARGTTLSVRLAGLPSAGRRSAILPWVVTGVVAAAAAIVVVYFARRKTPAARLVADDTGDEDELLAAIADLDESFESGRIVEDLYHAQRAKLKQDLVELIGRTKGPAAGG